MTSRTTFPPGTGLREPMSLPQEDRNSCQSCVTAQARWMLRLSDTAAKGAVSEADRLIGRKRGEPIAAFYSVQLLLSEGCQVINYGRPDIDVGRLHREGVTYFSQWKADDWSAAEAAYWTPDRLAAFAVRCEEWKSVTEVTKARYKSALTETGRPFTIADAEQVLNAGYIVITSYVDGHGSGESHAALIYGVTGDTFRLYVPVHGSSGLTEMSRARLTGLLRPYADAVLRKGLER